MKQLECYIYRCECGVTFDEVRGDRQAEEIFNGVSGEWQDYCPSCTAPVGNGELEFVDDE